MADGACHENNYFCSHWFHVYWNGIYFSEIKKSAKRMKKIIILSIIFLLFSLGVSAVGQEAAISSFKKVGDIAVRNIKVPTVIEAQIDGSLSSQHIGVYDKATNSFIPSLFVGNILAHEKRPINMFSGGFDLSDIYDRAFDTYRDFEIQNDGKGFISFEVVFSQPISSDSIAIYLEKYSALPDFVTIKAISGGKEKIVIFEQSLRSTLINFPKNTAERWKIELSYSQPLRISEIEIKDADVILQNQNKFRFIAQPGGNYALYADPDRVISLNFGEMPNLSGDDGVLFVEGVKLNKNPAYVESDIDGDKIPDLADNCPSFPNPKQDDVDGNKRGDACEDYDKDGVINANDNCPNKANYAQVDTDMDKIGDVCDGEESRPTEKYPWMVWVGIGFAFVVFLGLLFVVAKSKK
jgi:hypothetical protein